jgi:hypothetical protein
MLAMSSVGCNVVVNRVTRDQRDREALRSALLGCDALHHGV